MENLKNVTKPEEYKVGEYFKAKNSICHLAADHVYKLVGFKKHIIRTYSNNDDGNEKTISEAGIFIDMNDPECRKIYISFKNFDNLEKIDMEFKKGMMVRLKFDFANIDNCYILIRKGNIFSIKSFDNGQALLVNKSICFTMEENMLKVFLEPIFNDNTIIAKKVVEIKDRNNNLLCVINPGENLKVIRKEKDFVIVKSEKCDKNIVITNKILKDKF